MVEVTGGGLTVVTLEGSEVVVVGPTVGPSVGGEIVVVAGPSSGVPPEVEEETPRAMPMIRRATRTTVPMRMPVFWFGVLLVQMLFLEARRDEGDFLDTTGTFFGW